MRSSLTKLARAGLTAACLLWTHAASAAPVTVWLTDGPPEERFMARADRLTGETAHLHADDLRYPPEPVSADDTAAYDALAEQLVKAAEEWTEFEVELPIARNVAVSLGNIDVVRDDNDRDALIRALILQGTAAVRAFDKEVFASAPDAADFRLQLDTGEVVPAPWLRAWALMRDRSFERRDFPDGTAWLDLQRYIKTIESAEMGSIGLDPDAGRVWVDGKPVAAGAATIQVRPGRHYLHVVRDGVVSGRATVDVMPGKAAAMPVRITDEQIAATTDRVMVGSRAGYPAEVVAVLDAIGDHYTGDVFVGGVRDGRSLVVPYSEAAKLVDDRLVTVVLAADMGAGVMGTPIYEQNTTGNLQLAPAATVGASIEVGVSYFAVAAGLDASVTPGRTIAFANFKGTANRDTSVYPQPWGGIGAYALRPTGRKPTLAILGQVQWTAPSHLGYGGRVVIGIPVDNRVTWFRIALTGTYAPNTTYGPNAVTGPMVTGYLRLGIGSRL